MSPSVAQSPATRSAAPLVYINIVNQYLYNMFLLSMYVSVIRTTTNMYQNGGTQQTYNKSAANGPS